MSESDDIAYGTLLEITGSDDLRGVLDTLHAERRGMAELHDENNALRIYNRRLRLLVDYALRVYDDVEKVAGMFLTETARRLIAESRRQISQADKVILRSKEIVNGE